MKMERYKWTYCVCEREKGLVIKGYNKRGLKPVLYFIFPFVSGSAQLNTAKQHRIRDRGRGANGRATVVRRRSIRVRVRATGTRAGQPG